MSLYRFIDLVYLIFIFFKGETVITINEKKRETEEQMMMIELQNSMDGLRKVIISTIHYFE